MRPLIGRHGNTQAASNAREVAWCAPQARAHSNAATIAADSTAAPTGPDRCPPAGPGLLVPPGSSCLALRRAARASGCGTPACVPAVKNWDSNRTLRVQVRFIIATTRAIRRRRALVTQVEGEVMRRSRPAGRRGWWEFALIGACRTAYSVRLIASVPTSSLHLHDHPTPRVWSTGPMHRATCSLLMYYYQPIVRAQ